MNNIYYNLFALFICTVFSTFADNTSTSLKIRNLNDFTVGINTHHYFDKDYPLLNDLNVSSLRVLWQWNRVSDRKGTVLKNSDLFSRIESAPSRFKPPIVIFCDGHPNVDLGKRPVTKNAIKYFSKYSLDCASSLDSRESIYEIWNEWQYFGSSVVHGRDVDGTASDYLNLLSDTFHELKFDNPHRIILGGGTAGIGEKDNILEKQLRDGLLNNLDGLVIHPYFYGAPDRSERLPEKGLAIRMNKLRGRLSNYPKGPTVPIYVTELGWPTYDQGDGVTPAMQAKFMARSILILAIDPQVKGVWIYELRDGGINPGDPEHHFGLIKNDGTPKPAFWVMKDLKKVLDESKSIERMPVKAPDSLVMMRLPSKEGVVRWLCWTIQPDSRWKLRITGLGKGGTAKVSPLGRFGFPDGWRDEKKGAEIEIGDLPVCIESSSPNLVMESMGPLSSGSPAASPEAKATKRSGAASEILPSY